MDAPLSGGFYPGGRRFAVDGDFHIAWPSAAPEVYCPFEGDSQPSFYPIILLNRSIGTPDFVSVPIGSGFNKQPFNANQSAIVIEQEFMVAQEAEYQLPLNTPYNPLWATGWGNSYQNLENCFLVEEGPTVPVGGGIARFKRKFASLPENRNDYESYSAVFPALSIGGASTNARFGFTRIVNSRIFREFFVFDNLNLLASIPLYPEGHRINTTNPDTKPVLWEQFSGFAADAAAISNYQLLDPDAALADGPPATHPSYSIYKTWQGTAEIVAESSCFDRWLGNIYVRKTRFVVAI